LLRLLSPRNSCMPALMPKNEIRNQTHQHDQRYLPYHNYTYCYRANITVCRKKIVNTPHKSSMSTAMASKLLVRIFVSCVLTTTLYLVRCQAQAINDLVEVYDNVLDPETAVWLHHHCDNWPNHDVLFRFPLENSEKHSPIVQFLNQMLTQLYPNASSPMFYVEFWKRAEWHHILAHADMDEGWEKSTGHEVPLRHPETGHVLYLNIGSKVRGPTVLWNVTRGGDFPETESEMVVVPAVTGRLLRFQGDALHAVPRPANIYWTHKETHEEGRDYGRSVLLFNTWPIKKGVVQGYSLLDEEEASSSGKIHFKPQPVVNWTRIHPVSHPPDRMVESVTSSWHNWWPFSALMAPASTSFQVPLMGNRRRRGMEEYIVHLDAPKGAEVCFLQHHQVTNMHVRPSSKKRYLFGMEF